MARSKSSKLAPFQKLLTIMISGKPVTLEEMDALLGKEIYMYRISTYMWHIKTLAKGVVKPVKDGRKVTAYQIMNVKEVQEYMDNEGITGFTPGSATKKPSIAKLADLAAKPAPAKKAPAKKPAKPKKVEAVVDEVVVEEVTEVTE